MVKIYRWKELVGGKVATRPKIADTRAQALSIMRKLYSKGWIESGSIFGSVANETYSTGSDFDILIVSNPKYQRRVERYFQRLFRLSMDRGIELGIVHINSEEARTGNHSVDPFLLNHIQSTSSGTTVGKNPAELLRVSKRNPSTLKVNQLQYLINDLRKQRDRLSYNRVEDRDNYYSALEHALERPVSSARHLLDFLGVLPEKNGKVDDTKKTVVAVYSWLFSDYPDMVRSLKDIVDASARYRLALQHALDSIASPSLKGITRSKHEYDSAVQNIEFIFPQAERVFAENARLFKQLKLPESRKRFLRSMRRKQAHKGGARKSAPAHARRRRI